MKLCDITQQLLRYLPQCTTAFTEGVDITSIDLSGTTVTVVTAKPHQLKTGQTILMDKVTVPLAVQTLDQVDGVATLVTVEDHDLTQDFDEHNTAIVAGADQSGYNGTFEDVTVLNRKTIQYPVDDTLVPATGLITLDDGKGRGVNGEVVVTVVNNTTFTYELPSAISVGQLVANGPVITGARVGGSITVERFIDELYTAQPNNEDAWAIIVLGDSTASNNRENNTDATDIQSSGTELRQYVVEQFAVYVAVPSKDELAAMDARDYVESLKPAIFKSILGVKLPSDLRTPQQFGVTFVQDGFFRYDKAYYVHEFVFETVSQITEDDIFNENNSVPFKDICLLSQNSFKEVIMSSDINLDKEPL